MSSASPDDLAVTFRSVPRRLREAQGDTANDAFARLTGELTGLLSEAGQLMRSTADPVHIADAIAAVPADEWDSATLARLREIALGIGQQLRQLAAAGER
jgi:hypothetical protein